MKHHWWKNLLAPRVEEEEMNEILAHIPCRRYTHWCLLQGACRATSASVTMPCTLHQLIARLLAVWKGVLDGLHTLCRAPCELHWLIIMVSPLRGYTTQDGWMWCELNRCVAQWRPVPLHSVNGDLILARCSSWWTTLNWLKECHSWTLAPIWTGSGEKNIYLWVTFTNWLELDLANKSYVHIILLLEQNFVEKCATEANGRTAWLVWMHTLDCYRACCGRLW